MTLKGEDDFFKDENAVNVKNPFDYNESKNNIKTNSSLGVSNTN